MLVLVATATTACGAQGGGVKNNPEKQNITINTENNTKSIIVYYSRRGQNYVNGGIADLKVGNTEVVAGKIQEMTGSDIFRIETVRPYPEDYQETTEVAKRELNDQARPEQHQLNEMGQMTGEKERGL